MGENSPHTPQTAGERAHGGPFVPARVWRAAVFAVVLAAVVVLDRLTKHVVLQALMHGMFRVTVIPGVLDFTFVANRGAAFGLAQGAGYILVLLAVAVVIGSAVYLARTRLVSRVETVGLALVAGGAVGNAIDRVVLGFVVDFIQVRFIDFPVFNIADIGITVGVVVAFIGYLFLSPASKVDATRELNRRDEAHRARDAERRRRRAERSRRRTEGR